MRKLATMSISFAAAVFLAQYLLPRDFILPAAIAAAVMLILIILLKNRIYFAGVYKYSVFILPAFIVGLLIFFLNCKYFVDRAEPYDGSDAFLTGTVCSYETEYENYSKFTFRISSGNLKGIKVIAYNRKSELEYVAPGEVIRISGTLSSAGRRFDEDYSYNYAHGVFLTMSGISVEHTGEYSGNLSSALTKAAHSLKTRIKDIFLKIPDHLCRR